jgi:hypothetical protein
MRGIRHKVLEKLKAYKESFSADDVHRRQKEVRHHLTTAGPFVLYMFCMLLIRCSVSSTTAVHQCARIYSVVYGGLLVSASP